MSRDYYRIAQCMGFCHFFCTPGLKVKPCITFMVLSHIPFFEQNHIWNPRNNSNAHRTLATTMHEPALASLLASLYTRQGCFQAACQIYRLDAVWKGQHDACMRHADNVHRTLKHYAALDLRSPGRPCVLAACCLTWITPNIKGS